jgi:hypothetical protein
MAAWQDLAATLCQHALDHEVTKEEDTPFGKRYVIEGIIQAPDGRTSMLRAVWFIERGSGTPRFVTPTHCGGLAMIKELDTVVLTEDLSEHALKQGDIGTVVLVHDLAGYEVEFMTLNGETLAVVSLMPHQVRPVGPREIAQARAVEIASQ